MRAFNSQKTNQEIGMPDVEQELHRLKARRTESHATVGSRRVHHPLRQIAAMLVAALMLTGLGYAAVHTNFFTASWTEFPAATTVQAARDTDGAEPQESASATDSIVLFRNAPLDSIMTCIAQHYRMNTRFADESTKSIRMLLKWNTSQPLTEVLNMLNGFERVKVRRDKNTLIVEQPEAE